MTQTGHTGGTWVRVGSLPPGSLLCPTRGGPQSEPVGWSDPNPLLGTPPPGTRAATEVYGKIHGKFGPPRGAGGGCPPPGSPGPRRSGYDGASVATPPQPPLCTTFRPPSCDVTPGSLALSPSSASRTPLSTSGQASDIAVRPY